MVIAREITKLHEEIIRGKVSAVLNDLRKREIKGEVTILLNPRSLEAEKQEISLTDEIKKLQKELGLPIKEIAKIIAEQRGIPKREVYKEALKLKQS